MNNFDVITYISGNNNERTRNFNHLMVSLKNQRTVPDNIILIEQSIDGNFYHDPHDELIDYIPLKHETFNGSWCRNVGIHVSQNENVIVVEADAIFDCFYTAGVVEQFKDKRAAIGWDLVISLSDYGTNYFLEHEGFPGPVTKAEFIDHIIISDHGVRSRTNVGIVNIFNRQWFVDNLNGYCELMYHWGGEDCEIFVRARTATEVTWLNLIVGHLAHRRNYGFGTYNSEILEYCFDNAEKFRKILCNYKMGDPQRPLEMINEKIENWRGGT